MSLDNMQQHCAHCGVFHHEETMNCCNRCGLWSCQGFTEDNADPPEICDDCWPEHCTEEAERAAERAFESYHGGGGGSWRDDLDAQRDFLRSIKRP